MKGIPQISMRRALADPRFFGALQSMDLTNRSWDNWCVVLTAAFPDPSEPLDKTERAIFTKLTGRSRPPKRPPRRMAFRVARRGGKDAALSLIIAYLAGCVDWRPILKRPGELGTVLVLANNREQAKISHDGIRGVFQESPALRKMITSETSDTIILGKQRVQIVIRAAEAASLRGYTLIGVGLSEFAFFEWREFMQGNDTELICAIEPGLLTSGGPLIMCSSPWCAEGAFYDICTKGWGDDGPDDTLVVHGASFDLNPTLLSDQ